MTDGAGFHYLNCLGHAARKLLDRALARGDAEVIAHVNGCRVSIKPIGLDNREEKQNVPVVDRYDYAAGEQLPEPGGNG